MKQSKFSKWTPSKTGYKSSGKSYGNSSFWMDDDFLEDRGTTNIFKVDALKLAGYKRAIGNFVRIVTGKDDIKVSFNSGKQSYTDGKTVVISSNLDENEFDSTVGLALHEGSHIALTDFNTLKKRLYWPTVGSGPGELNYIFEKHQDTITQDEFCNRIKSLVNIIEDRRIDRYIYDNAPGYKGYYQSLYDKYFNAKEIDNALLNGTMTEENWNCYEFHICNFANPNRQLNSLKALRRIWNLINLPNISRLKSTDMVFDVAVQVYCLIHDEIGWVGTPTVPTAAQPTAGGEEEGEDKETQTAEGGDSNDNGEDDNLDVPTGGAQASQKLSKEEAKAEKEKKALDKAIAKQKQFLNGNIKKKSLSNKDADRVEAIAAANMEYATVGGSVEGFGRQGTTQCIVVRGVNTAVLNSQVVNSHWSNPQHVKKCFGNGWRGGVDYVQEGINLGILLGKRLKTRDEERSLKTTRMETGRIDKRLISELGFGNDRVFSQTIHNTVTPSIVHISIDASGSMCGSKWNNSVKTAVAIAKAASMVSSLDVVISLRGTYQQSPLMWIVYDSRKDKFNSSIDVFYGIQASGSTPEGLCYQAVMKDIVKAANGKDAYLINLCDGEPGWGGYGSSFYYGGDYALKHTAAQVEKMRKEGIKVLGYFIGEGNCSSSMESFKKMYGKDSEFIDTNSLTQLSKSLNALFERK